MSQLSLDRLREPSGPAADELVKFPDDKGNERPGELERTDARGERF
jgi:hypothetical protein